MVFLYDLNPGVLLPGCEVDGVDVHAFDVVVALSVEVDLGVIVLAETYECLLLPDAVGG